MVVVVLMPPSALQELAQKQISYPMTFMISNSQFAKKTFCGVNEFVAEEGTCNIPMWMQDQLLLEEGSEVLIRSVNLKKGTFCKFQPHKTAFIDIPNFKEM